MTKTEARKKLLAAGVKHLKAFGYPAVTVENILMHYVFRQFFRSQLEGTKDEIEELRIKDPNTIAAIDELIAEIDAAKESP